MSHKISTQWKGNMLFESTNPGNHKVLMDTSAENGGNDAAPGPKALMLSGLAGCSGLDVVSMLKKMKVEVNDIKINVEAELTDEHPKIYDKVQVNYHFYGTALNQEKINRAVNLSIEKYCGVMEMFRRFSEVKTEVFFHEE